MSSAPVATVEEARGAQVIASLDAGGRAAGLRVGQPLRDALASCPDLVTRPRDPWGEAALMGALARWAGRFTPWVALWAEAPEASRPDALALDVTGCAHLWGDEAAMVQALMEGCAAMGITARAGLADTPGAAWALARYGGGCAKGAGHQAPKGDTHSEAGPGIRPEGGAASGAPHRPMAPPSTAGRADGSRVPSCL